MNYKCRKRLTDKLVKNCDENIDDNETISNKALYDFWLFEKVSESYILYVIVLNGKVCKFCTLYITLIIMVWILIVMSIKGKYLYFHCYIIWSYINPLSYYTSCLLLLIFHHMIALQKARKMPLKRFPFLFTFQIKKDELKLNKESHWVQVSRTKILGD